MKTWTLPLALVVCLAVAAVVDGVGPAHSAAPADLDRQRILHRRQLSEPFDCCVGAFSKAGRRLIRTHARGVNRDVDALRDSVEKIGGGPSIVDRCRNAALLCDADDGR